MEIQTVLLFIIAASVFVLAWNFAPGATYLVMIASAVALIVYYFQIIVTVMILVIGVPIMLLMKLFTS